MPDEKKVIDDLNIAKNILIFPQMLSPEMHIKIGQAISAAIALLKEREPKQIIRKREKYSDGSISRFAEWYCPHCNMLILRGFSDPSIKFCYRCGKPILWEIGEVE